MAIKAKVSSGNEPVSAGVEQTAGNNIAISAGENVALDVPPEAVQSLERVGNDLVVQLKDGQIVRIDGFYGAPDQISHLYLVENGKLVSAELGTVASDGVVAASYAPVGAAADFTVVEGAAAAAAGGAGGGLGIAGIVGGLAVVGGGVAVAGGGGGNGDNGGENTPPPAAATNLAISSTGTQLTGTAAAGTTVRVDTNGDGTPETTVTVGSGGTFTVPLSPPLTNGETVTVTVVGPAGQVSTAATAIAPDTTPPPVPTAVLVSANGTHVTGTGQAGSTVRIDINGDGTADATGTVGANGQFDVTLPTALTNGETVSVTAVDAAGNASGSATATAPDTTPPAAPTGVQLSLDGLHVTGTAEAGSIVRVDTNGDGVPDATATAGANGQFDVVLGQPLANGETVAVTAADAAGNASAAATLIAPDTTPPAAPTAQVSGDGTHVTGSAEPGSTVTITVNGVPQGTATAGANGQYDVPLTEAQTNGQTVTVTTTDPAGNPGPASTAVAPDLVPGPDAPTIAPSNGASFSGTGDAGTTLILRTAGGVAIGQTTIAADGTWSFTPASPISNATVVVAISRDASGQTGPAASTVTDSLPPAAPVIALSNGTVLSGTAEAGATVALTTGAGVVIGETTANAAGAWSFTPAAPLPDGTVVNATARDALGNVGDPASTTIDGVAPSVPVLDVTGGSVISGTGEPGSTVTLTDGNGAAIGVVTVGQTGTFSFTPAAPLADGTVVNAVASDAAGNVSAAGNVTVDAQPPQTPTIDPSNGTALTGTAEGGSVVLLNAADGTVIGEATVDSTGHWTFTPTTPLPDGTVVKAISRDPTDNVSAPVAITIDATAPDAPTINHSRGIEFTGTAEAGSTVILTDNGTEIGRTTADADGNWVFTPAAPILGGDTVSATATDAAGNVSLPSDITVDTFAPPRVRILRTNGRFFVGQAEPDSTVILTDDNGDVIGQTTADDDGNWQIEPDSPVPDDTVVTAVSIDAAGNTSDPETVTVDFTLPSNPIIDPTNGTVISGTGDAGNTILLTDGNGNAIGQVVVGSDGHWIFSPPTQLADGTVVQAVAEAADGTQTDPTVAVVDGVAPGAPVIAATNGSVISGTAEAGATVTLTDGNGNAIGQVTADANGRWTFSPTTALADGTVVNATATDPAGNTSGQASATVDGAAPAAPTIAATNGVALHGTGEAGATILLTDGNGAAIGQTTANASGQWSFAPPAQLAGGTVVNAVARDAAGNVSTAATTTVDGTAPAAPVIDPTNGTLVTGTAEAGGTVTLRSGGTTLGTATVDGTGHWTFTPATPLANGVVVSASETDAAGNIGATAATVVDAVAPSAPTIDRTNGTALAGTAEANATVILTDGAGNAIGQAAVDGTGHWSFTPGAPLANGTVVNAVARDAAGNNSVAATTTVDSVAPPPPVLQPSDGSILTGTAEVGSTVKLTRIDGTVIATVQADANGQFSVPLSPALLNGVVVSATAADATGNVSTAASVTVDSLPPPAPTIDPTNGAALSGTAEVGTVVILTDNGVLVGQATVDANGNWSFSPVIPLLDGTVVVAVARDASGNLGASASTTIDAQAPLPPIVAPSNGTTLAGTGEAGATVILTDGNGNAIGQTTVGVNGQWSFTPAAPLANGTVVNAVAVDAIGNASTATAVTVDAVAPGVPTIDPSNGIAITGSAEAGSTVTLTDANGAVVGTVVADTTGSWRFVPPTSLPNGAVLNVVATDAVGNVSTAATLTIDAQPPAAPSVGLSNGLSLSGTAEAGATVNLIDGSGNPIGQVTAGAGGAWTFTPTTQLADGTIVRVTATDAAGNVSLASAVTIDGVAPGTPVVAPTNGTQVRGTADVGATVTVRNGLGVVIGQTLADATGAWSIVAAVAVANGEQLSVTASDPTGNVSVAATVTVDSVAPAAPVITPTNGTHVVGTAEANSTITLTIGGAPLATVTADANGHWAFAPALPLAGGAIVAATATDAAGNVSSQATATVDTAVPGIPTLDPSNGVSVHGTAEAGAIVTLTDQSGTVLGSVTADGSGNWTFTFPVPLADGAIVRATAEDLAGNIGSPASITVDAVAPGVPAITLGNGTTVSGTGEVGATILLTGAGGAAIGQVTVGAGGTWTFNPGAPLANGLVVNAAARDAAGNTSTAARVTIDALAPAVPTIAPSSGAVLSGNAEIGSIVTVKLADGTVVGQVTADAGGHWAVTPLVPLANGVAVTVTATDASANVSPAASLTIDAVAPGIPTGLVVSADGATLTGIAEANSQVRIVIDGDTAHPILATVGAGGTFSVPLSPALTLGQELTVTAADAAGNVSLGAIVEAPDLVPPLLTIAETADGYLNKVEAANGIQVVVGLTAGTDAGDTIKLHYAGAGGASFDQTHVVTAAERLAGSAAITVIPQQGQSAFPEGAATINASIDTGPSSVPVGFVVDQINPSTPVLSLVGSLLSLSADPGETLNVNVALAGITATAQVTANGQGLASLDLLSGLSIQPSWDDLLNASVSVQGSDPAGNVSNVATVGINSGIAPVTLGGFGLAVGLLPPTLGLSGTAPVGGYLTVDVITPAATVSLHPVIDAQGNYSINLLSGSLLSQLGLTITGLLNLGAGLGFHITAADAAGHQTADYGLTLLGSGASLGIGTITVSGGTGNDVLQGRDTQVEVFNSGSGSDLILHVGTGDVVNAGNGNDTVQISAANTGNIDGGAGFDTLMFDHGININYGAVGVGTWHGLERVNLGKDGQASTLTLTAAQVNSITDGGNVLQITGDTHDTLNVTGAVNTGTTAIHDGVSYDVYTFGATQLQVEHNTVVVVH